MTDPLPRGEQRRQRKARRSRVLVGALVLLVVLAAGGVFIATRSDSGTKTANRAPTTTTPASVGDVSTSFGAPPLRAVLAKDADIPVYSAPTTTSPPTSTLSMKTVPYGVTRSLLAFDQYQGWLHVYLPTRPNDGTGWVQASDVSVSQPLEYQIKVSLADHKVTLLHDGAVVWDAPAAIGTAENPTPTGLFYYTDPIDLKDDPGTAYGVFAIGLSGHSNTLSEFNGGDGQIAIHGTNDPGTIGQSVSHGCVRVNNDVILKLSKLPLGTPVMIT